MEERERERLRRRDLLRLCALGVSAPIVVSLAPREARALGSWRGRTIDWQHQPQPFSERPAQTAPNASDPNAPAQNDPQAGQSGGAWYGGWEWRQRRYQEAVERRRQVGEFGRFGEGAE